MSRYEARDEDEMLELGRALAGRVGVGHNVFLVGDLGAGKTTLVRGMLHALGWEQPVKSPTYTLVEEYRIGGRVFYHFDFYRINDPMELELIGIRDMLNGASTGFMEWPERARGVLPPADLEIHVRHHGHGRRVELRGNNAGDDQ